MTPDPRFSLLLYDCPKWLLEAYHHNTTVYHSLNEAMRRGWDDKTTLLHIVKVFVGRDTLQESPEIQERMRKVWDAT